MLLPPTEVVKVEGTEAVAAEAAGVAAAPPPSRPDSKVDAKDVPLVDTSDSGPAHTVAGLGDPTRPGLWMETPLVRAQTQARVAVTKTARSVTVTLIPIEGPPTGGSRLSLEAMRILDVPLTDLVELDVYRG